MASKMAFASLSIKEMVKSYNMVTAALRTTTILIGKEKSPNNLVVMEYMSELKIMTNLRFKGHMAQVKWDKLGRFIPGAQYWIERYTALEDDGERMTVNYGEHGEVEIPKGVHVDGTPFTEQEINFKMDAIYEAWPYMLQFNEKAMELLKEHVNVTGMFDKDDTLHAAASLQYMKLELHMISRVGTSEILSRVAERFTKNIVDHLGAEQLVQEFQTFANLLDRSSTNGSQANSRLLLTRLAECMQVAMQVKALPF
jgi:hypothetical protein